MRKIVLSATLALLASTAFAITPSEFIKKESSEVLSLVQKGKNVQEFKKELRITVNIDELIDFENLSRTTLGKYWRTANDEQKAAFSKEFKEFLINFYSNAMFSFKDASIDYKNEVNTEENSTVKTMVTYKEAGSKKQAAVTYVLVKNNDTWKISDVTIEGITLSFMYRDSFSNIITQKGLDGLISDLKDKNAKNRNK